METSHSPVLITINYTVDISSLCDTINNTVVYRHSVTPSIIQCMVYRHPVTPSIIQWYSVILWHHQLYSGIPSFCDTVNYEVVYRLSVTPSNMQWYTVILWRHPTCSFEYVLWNLLYIKGGYNNDAWHWHWPILTLTLIHLINIATQLF